MVGHLVRLKLTLLRNGLKRSVWQVVLLCLGVLYALSALAVATGGLMYLSTQALVLRELVVVVLGAVAAELAATQPMLALAFPAVMLINATFFHVGPFLVTRGRFSPGLITAVILFYPIGIACFRRVAADGHLDSGTLAGALALGAALMAAPVVMLKAKDRLYFRQDRPLKR